MTGPRRPPASRLAELLEGLPCMKHVEPTRLRNVVLAGHAGSGKTTLAEHLLHSAGAISRLGRVDDGTASLDFEPEEQKRHLSLALAVATLDHEGHRITLVDTPGYADFVGEMIAGVRRGGCGGHHHGRVGRRRGRHGDGRAARPRERGAPALFVITRSERENADPTAALDALRAELRHRRSRRSRCAIGAAERFRGYVDLVHRVAYMWQGDRMSEAAIPADLADEVARRREQLVEAAAEADDDVMTKYLEGEDITRRGAGGVPPRRGPSQPRSRPWS